MAWIAAPARWRPGLRTWILSAIGALLLVVLTALAVSTAAWGDALRDEGRLLPGTVVATVDVGDHTAEEAVAAVEERLEERLDRVVTVEHGDHAWEVTARELGAETDVDEVVADALQRTHDAGLAELARIRYGGTPVEDRAVAMGIPDEQMEAFVAGIADTLDREARDAEVRWTDDGLAVDEHRDGRFVEQEDTVAELDAALAGDADTVQVLFDRPPPEIDTDDADAAVAALGPAIDAALDHTVTAELDGRTWSVSPRELGAAPDLDALLEVAYTDGPDAAADAVDVRVGDEALADYVASIAADVDVPARDAEATWTGGGLQVTPERTGVALARDAATEDLRDALAGGGDRVELTQHTIRPQVTAASLNRMLLLRQDERRVYLYEDGEPIRDWPVAVGLAGSPTPTGTFTVGAKRFEPIWVNPAPDRWGADMPERIGPGPENPLGTRAINWNRNGRDTLIRFHGTPNEDSIGEAASQGCVRMFNSDVEELYELVSSGMVIVSVR